MTTLAEAYDRAALSTPSNPHLLWRQLLGLVVWVALIAGLTGGPLGAAICLLLAGLTFADAWTSGIYKYPAKKTFLNLSPMGWGICMALLLLVAYPLYLANRGRLRTVRAGNAYFVAVIAVGAVILVALVLSLLFAGLATKG